MPVTILYVEDNQDLRESTALALEAPGRALTSCGSGEEAWALLEQQAYDVVITDAGLPGISGVALAQRLVARNPAQRLVLCSGYDLTDALAALGPHARLLTKPFDLDALDAVLAALGVPPPV